MLPRLAPEGGEVPEAFIRRVPHLRVTTRPGDLERWLRAAGLAVRLGFPVRQYGHLYVAYEAALAGDGWVIAPRLAAEEDLRHGRLAEVFPAFSNPGASLYLLVSDNPAEGARTAPIRAWVRQAAEASMAGHLQLGD